MVIKIARKPKTKYTMRSDGRIVKTKVYPDGTKKFFYGATDREVEAKEAAYDKVYDSQPKKKCRTMEQLVDDYWEIKEAKLSPNTYNSYRTACKRIKEAFGESRADEISMQDIYKFLNRFSVQGYSSKVISNTRSVLKGVLDQAFIVGEIESNPCTAVPTVTGKPRQRRASASSEDIVTLYNHREDNMLTRLMFFSLLTGLRRGELAALQFKHIDLQAHTLSVVQSCAWDSTGKPVIKSPKSEAGYRVVDLVDMAIDILPPVKSPDSFVFFPDGIPRRGKLETDIERIRKELGITSTLHQLRHGFATIGHSAGIDAKDMQHELGHSTVSLTLDIYTDLENAQRKRVRNKLNKYVNKELFKQANSKVVK